MNGSVQLISESYQPEMQMPNDWATFLPVQIKFNVISKPLWLLKDWSLVHAKFVIAYCLGICISGKMKGYLKKNSNSVNWAIVNFLDLDGGLLDINIGF